MEPSNPSVKQISYVDGYMALSRATQALLSLHRRKAGSSTAPCSVIGVCWRCGGFPCALQTPWRGWTPRAAGCGVLVLLSDERAQMSVVRWKGEAWGWAAEGAISPFRCARRRIALHSVSLCMFFLRLSPFLQLVTSRPRLQVSWHPLCVCAASACRLEKPSMEQQEFLSSWPCLYLKIPIIRFPFNSGEQSVQTLFL